MRIRKFNENKGELYDRIIISKREEMISEKGEKFTKHEIRKIMNLVENRGMSFQFPESGKIVISENKGGWGKRAAIYKCEDNWFIVIWSIAIAASKSYICDSMEGLVECLEKEEII